MALDQCVGQSPSTQIIAYAFNFPLFDIATAKFACG